jgi:hypothetical protein
VVVGELPAALLGTWVLAYSTQQGLMASKMYAFDELVTEDGVTYAYGVSVEGNEVAADCAPLGEMENVCWFMEALPDGSSYGDQFVFDMGIGHMLGGWMPSDGNDFLAAWGWRILSKSDTEEYSGALRPGTEDGGRRVSTGLLRQLSGAAQRRFGALAQP